MASLSNTKKEIATKAADHLRMLLTDFPVVYVVRVHQSRKTSWVKILHVHNSALRDLSRYVRDAALQNRSTEHGVRGAYRVSEVTPSAIIQHVQERLDLLKIGKQIDVYEI